MILVTGAAGQIGSELVRELRARFGSENVVAGKHRTPLPEAMEIAGPSALVDVTNREELDTTIKNYGIKTVFHMSSILSALAEQNVETAHEVNINGVFNLFQISLENDVEQLIIPSSIAAFGPDTPKSNTPNDTIQKPNTVYGISKVFTELMGNYYQQKFDLDVRGIRLPGVISWETEPTAGTTDYAVAMFYGAIRSNQYECYLKPDTRLPMMYMPDAIKAILDISKADYLSLNHHCDFNVHAMSFTPSELANCIKDINPSFQISYKIDPLRQSIADSWPDSLDDNAARMEWGWKPAFDMRSLVNDMYRNLESKLT
ncbi:NAD-dependent epimerase/dehydratase family protein [Dehalococcoidia bacterium]|nr:NAD-dependent epimerase/dehydratase family protein [Dehalococcoidia bacterium]